ncbi:MAG: hypothetical protein IKJ42_03735 [Bacteroidaceae bacterium]|nr:hypothetical protein [Bacteroidaceae bacterium]
MRKILLILFLCLHWVARGQTGFEYRYWFDGQSEIWQEGTSQEAAWDMQIDVAQLSDGLHFLHYQVTESDTLHSPVRTALFVKKRVKEEMHDFTVYCYINDSLWTEQNLTAEGGLIDWNLDVNTLKAETLHSMLVVMKLPDGKVVATKQAFFMRAKTAEELGELTCFYSLDGGKTIREGGILQDKGFCFDVDIESLNDGLHQLLCMLVDDEGTVIRTCTYHFIKQRDTNLRYDYWVNDDMANLRTVVANHVKPYHLMDMLEVGTYPIRSMDFHFEVEEGTPYIYGKNDLHVRVYNSQGGYAEESCMFIDGASRKEVIPMAELQHGEIRTDATPAQNEIHWYQVKTVCGDSLVFNISQAANLQVFSPTGARLLDVSGEEAKQAGCAIAEDGVCYVALHDVTGTATETAIGLNILNPTGINTVVARQLVDVYNLQGIRVKSQIPMERIKQELPRGIYIINGKKMLIR